MVGHDRHRAAPGTDPLAVDSSAFGRHDVVLSQGSAARALLGPRITVNSFHHQAIDDPGSFTVTGRCPDDRVIVSEPFSDLPGVWHEIEPASAVTVPSAATMRGMRRETVEM